MSPKICKCGEQGHIINSRQQSNCVTRRYSCSCGERWTSFELRLQEGVYCKDVEEMLIRQYSTIDRDNIADQLIAMAQGLLKGGEA